MVVMKMRLSFPEGSFGLRAGEQMRVAQAAVERGMTRVIDRVTDEIVLRRMSLSELLYHALVEPAEAEA
jgi:hypothetical protein